MDNSSILGAVPSSSIIFDLEADALYDRVTKLHSFVGYDYDSKELHSHADQYGYEPLGEGILSLDKYKYIIGHNIINYDLPVLDKLLRFIPKAKVIDTYNLSTLIFTNLLELDFKKWRYEVPKELKGHHTLEAWGYRLGVYKGGYGKTADWREWSKEMQEYCEQDVMVNVRLVEFLCKQNYMMEAVNTEMEFQKFISVQEKTGVNFDEKAALELDKKLSKELVKLDMKIADEIPPWEVKLKTKVRYDAFNPGSRDQCVKYLVGKYNWKPEIFSKKTGKPSFNAEVLETITYPEVEWFRKRFDIKNLKAKLSTGKESWLGHVHNGKIHGRVKTNGAVTGRCTHASPNLAQVTSPRKYMGAEARACFIAPEGMKLVGADAAGLELRVLAHYLAGYDDGKYADIVVNGDIHTSNQEAAGLPTRDHAKTFIYAFNYGAGDELLGSILDKSLTVTQKKNEGANLRAKFLDRTEGLGKLITGVKNAAKFRGFLKGIDGRRLHVRSQHMALNTLLQGGGAVIMKRSGIMFWDYRCANLPSEVLPVLNVHDEMQIISPEPFAEKVGEALVDSIIKSGEYYNFKCVLDGTYNIGNNWMETH